MKLYAVAEGTKGLLIRKGPFRNDFQKSPWSTRKDLKFSDAELVFDPVMAYNNPSSFINTTELDDYEKDLVSVGYAIFNPPVHEEKGWVNGYYPKYRLAVLYNNVEVVC